VLASIRRFSPRSAVILMMAYGIQDVIEGASGPGVCTVMSKPFDMHDLTDVFVRA